jgi:hypothetical protein
MPERLITLPQLPVYGQCDGHLYAPAAHAGRRRPLLPIHGEKNLTDHMLNTEVHADHLELTLRSICMANVDLIAIRALISDDQLPRSVTCPMPLDFGIVQRVRPTLVLAALEVSDICHMRPINSYGEPGFAVP